MEITLIIKKRVIFFVADFKAKIPRQENKIKKMRIKRKYNLRTP